MNCGNRSSIILYLFCPKCESSISSRRLDFPGQPTSLTSVTTSSQPRWASRGDTLHPNAGLAAPVICEMDSSKNSGGARTLLPRTVRRPYSSQSESGTCNDASRRGKTWLLIYPRGSKNKNARRDPSVVEPATVRERRSELRVSILMGGTERRRATELNEKEPNKQTKNIER